MLPAAVTVVAVLASETVGGVVSLPRFTGWPLITTATMLPPENVPEPLKPTSQVWPFWMALYCSQLGLVAVRLPEASGAEMLPFHGTPVTPAPPASLKT